MDWYDDQPPYSSIGVQTTLPVREGDKIPKQRPIGFIWPKRKNATKPIHQGRGRRKAKASKR